MHGSAFRPGPDMNPSQQSDSRPHRSVQISVIVVGNIIYWMFMLAAIGLGVTHLNGCPLQPNIPIYLIVLGANSLTALSLTYTRESLKDACVLSSFCIGLLHLFTFCWVVTGSVWVYRLYPPNYTPGRQYCHKTTYLFAFAVTSLMWAIMFISLCVIGLLVCCKIGFERGRLISNGRPYYGVIGKEPAAGDV